MVEIGSKYLRSRFKILQITAHPFPPAIRVVKEGITLLAGGYQSAVMCPPIQGRPQKEIWNGITIFRPDPLSSSKSLLDKLLYHTVFYSPAWYDALKEVFTEYKPDVLHVHDIWLGRSVLRAKTSQWLIIDLHENMPAAVVETLPMYRGLFKWFNAVFKTYSRVLRYERSLLRESDKVFVVVKEALERVLECHPNVAPGKVVNIENLESKRFIQSNSCDERESMVDGDSILYIGGFAPHRGIDTLIRAMKHIKTWGLNARLYLVGARDCDYLDMVKDLISNLDVASHVTVVGWVPAESVLAYIRQAVVGAVPHHSNPHTDNTIPHKLYQYMIASTPVLVSTSPPLARTVRAAGAGEIFEAGDDLDCAIRIREMLNDPNLLKRYGARGFKYVMQEGHNWEEESAPALIKSYDNLLGITHSSGSVK